MRFASLALLAGLLVQLRPSVTQACAPAPPHGIDVRIAEESALIIWDAATQTEHFIRRASFRTSGADFGFLVPTPTKPELAETPNSIFEQLSYATRPAINRVVEHRGVKAGCVCAGALCLAGASKGMDSAAPPVRVLEEKRVAGYDAVVLEADDPQALATWLRERGYADKPTLRDWLTPYVSSHWKITAFRIADKTPTTDAAAPTGPTKVQGIGTAAVRMTFKTEKPFYPYREPEDQRTPDAGKQHIDRMLKVFFIDTARAQGAIGPEAAAWRGKTVWAGRAETSWLKELGAVTVPHGAWLTVFEDNSSPRPGTDDLFFRPSQDKSEVRPTPTRWVDEQPYFIPLELVFGAAAVGFWFWRRRKPPEPPPDSDVLPDSREI